MPTRFAGAQNFQYDVRVLIYDGFNHNLGFMLEFNFELLIQLGMVFILY